MAIIIEARTAIGSARRRDALCLIGGAMDWRTPACPFNR